MLSVMPQAVDTCHASIRPITRIKVRGVKKQVHNVQSRT